MVGTTTSIDFQNILLPKRIIIIKQTTKHEALKELAHCLGQADEISNQDELIQGIFHREELMSTGIGLGIGVPHVRLASISEPVMALGICHEPITDYEAMDGEPISIIFMIAAGQQQHTEHLRLLSMVSSHCKDANLRESLKQATCKEDVMRILGIN